MITNEKSFDRQTKSPCQHLRKCIENSMKNMHTDVKGWRVKSLTMNCSTGTRQHNSFYPALGLGARFKDAFGSFHSGCNNLHLISWHLERERWRNMYHIGTVFDSTESKSNLFLTEIRFRPLKENTVQYITRHTTSLRLSLG